MINKNSAPSASDSRRKRSNLVMPIKIRHNSASERETAYLLSSAKMKLRLLDAMERCDGISLAGVLNKFGF